ncbi:MAG: NFACT family protein, partial [Oscillospiraceae bacterium]
MALDGMFLNTIVKEIKSAALNSRVEKISQPSREEVVISLRCRGENGSKNESKKLLISANASAPRLHFTTISLENPASPPMFCMLLRKHLNTARLIDVTQNSLDRTINLVFEAVDELGDLTTAKIIIEIMGRHSNVILVNSAGKVVDSLKRITNELSSVRMILPGITYELPPSQNKINLLTCDINEILNKIISLDSNDLPKAILQTIEGISPLLAREIAFNSLGEQYGKIVQLSKLSDFYKNKIKEQLMLLKDCLLNDNFIFSQYTCEKIKLRDFTFININQYGNKIEKTIFKTASELLDEFYKSRDQYSRMK